VRLLAGARPPSPRRILVVAGAHGHGMSARELLALSDERAAALRLRLLAWREGRREGYAAGYRAGYDRAHRELEAAWHEIADPASRRGIPWAELEQRRWGPGGREHFGDPRPGDYLGGGAH
jgi:hypothetical protein